MDHENTGNGLAWSAMIVAIIALILAWVAFNRTGQDVLPATEDAVENAAQEVEQGAEELEEEADEEFVDEDEPMDEVETDTSIDVRS